MKRTIIASSILALIATSIPGPFLVTANAQPAAATSPAATTNSEPKALQTIATKDGELKLESGKPGLMANTNKVVFTNLNQKASYVLGVQSAATMAMDGMELMDVEMVVRGIRDVFERRMPLVSQDEADDILKKFQEKILEADAERKKKEASDNKEKGIKFLEENAKKEGIVVTDSGLQYKVAQAGTGESPNEDDRVLIHFRARNVDGIEFSNSYKHKTPIPTLVRSQIKAFREALVMMKKGAKWELFVPSELAYGQREVGKGVGPNSALIFELELVDIDKPKTDAKKSDEAKK